ncbi:MAG: hypothetical protein Q8L27_03570 [archaeon]|nr:hypothetical protein [archaeon]
MEIEEYDINEEEFFSEESLNEMLEDDEISSEEAGFLKGYMDEC